MLFKITEGQNFFIDIKIAYMKGGMNYFTGEVERRGYFLVVKTVEKDGLFTSSRIFSDISGNNIENFKYFLVEAKRYSNRKEFNLNNNGVVIELFKKLAKLLLDGEPIHDLLEEMRNTIRTLK